MPGEKFVQIFVYSEIELVPVVEAGAAHGLVAYVETERLYQVQPRAGDGAGAGDVAGIGGNFRLDEYNVYHGYRLCPRGFPSEVTRAKKVLYYDFTACGGKCQPIRAR